ncbi:MAG: dUTP diphosphatase [Legionellales bacterium]|jgi:dUTP pyrophosphatase|nr:dUTP diphosphatase [Legionellales bacterium]
MKVQVKIINEKIGNSIEMPSYATSGSAGIDLRACCDSDVSIAPGKTVMIGTGIAIYIGNPDYAAMILPRSGLGHKYGIILGNTIGLIDSDYQGELKVSCWNRSDSPYTIKVGERFAQLVFTRVYQSEMEVVSDFEVSARGTGGFGSTGTDKVLEETSSE